MSDLPVNHPAARALAWAGRQFTNGALIGSLIARHGWPGTFLHYWITPGDDMLLTAVLHEMRLRGRKRLWVMTQNPELFAGNPDVHAAIPVTPWLPGMVKRIGWNVIRPEYNSYLPEEDRDVVDPHHHIITSFCRTAGLTGRVCLRPYMHLSPQERKAGRIADRQIAFQSSGMAANTPMITKQWYPDRFAAVVAALKHKFNFVQLGSPADPMIDGAIDLRGKTSLRQSAAVLAESTLFVGTVGFLMHLARAVECRSVVVYGGRELPSQSGYRCNENLYTPLACSPCWKRFSCPYDRECMKRISPDEVIAAIERQAARKSEPLEVDEEMIPEISPRPVHV